MQFHFAKALLSGDEIVSKILSALNNFYSHSTSRNFNDSRVFIWNGGKYIIILYHIVDFRRILVFRISITPIG